MVIRPHSVVRVDAIPKKTSVKSIIKTENHCEKILLKGGKVLRIV